MSSALLAAKKSARITDGWSTLCSQIEGVTELVLVTFKPNTRYKVNIMDFTNILFGFKNTNDVYFCLTR